MTRRDLLMLAGAATLHAQQAPAPLKIALFSKHLQFLEGAAMVKAAKDTGVDALDLTVRKGGHVEPARVKQDLPALVKLIQSEGLEVPMVTTDIVDATTPFADEILGTLNDLGIRYYRWGGFKWENGKPLTTQIEAFRPRVAALAKLNASHQTTAMYHTHSGIGLVGNAIWDLHEILKGQDPKLVGVNYDIGHATIEGGLGGWIESFRITGPYLQGIAVKDFIWNKGPKGWREEWQPLGTGMVKFPQFFGMVKAANFHGPLQLHFEYELGGAQDGKRLKDLTMPPAEILAAMKRDATTLRSYLS